MLVYGDAVSVDGGGGGGGCDAGAGAGTDVTVFTREVTPTICSVLAAVVPIDFIHNHPAQS